MTKAVHQAGGKIFIQLWHVGRVSHVSLQPGGAKPVAPSASTAKTKTFIETGFTDASEPRALSVEDIAGVVADYKKAAENAKRAGFDGIEIHGANGYLIDQFLKDGVNKRTDHYGQSIENRARFALEVTDAILQVWDRSRVGIRLSPVSPFNDAVDSNPEAIFFYLVSSSARETSAISMSSRGRPAVRATLCRSILPLCARPLPAPTSPIMSIRGISRSTPCSKTAPI